MPSAINKAFNIKTQQGSKKQEEASGDGSYLAFLASQEPSPLALYRKSYTKGIYTFLLL
jgi:hypothetical protein